MVYNISMDTPIIGKGERWLIYGFAGIVDFIQIIFSLFVATEVFNHGIDIVIGGVLLIYAYKRKLLTPNKIMVLGATFVGEQIPFVNALPFWVYDVHNLYKDVPSDASSIKMDVVVGRTPPRNQRTPVNSIPGRRPPRLPTKI